MNVFEFNTAWMVYNLYLGVLSVIFSRFLFKMPHRIYSWIAGTLWFLYLPNTIYIFSDLHHLVERRFGWQNNTYNSVWSSGGNWTYLFFGCFLSG